MADNVFIFGAGASVESGAPTMTTFMDAAEDVLARGEAGNYKEDFEFIFGTVRRELSTVYEKADLDLNNIEALFGSIEMAAILGRLGSLTGDAIGQARSALVRL